MRITGKSFAIGIMFFFFFVGVYFVAFIWCLYHLVLMLIRDTINFLSDSYVGKARNICLFWLLYRAQNLNWTLVYVITAEIFFFFCYSVLPHCWAKAPTTKSSKEMFCVSPTQIYLHLTTHSNNILSRTKIQNFNQEISSRTLSPFQVKVLYPYLSKPSLKANRL